MEQVNQTPFSQKELFSKALLEIKNDVTRDDRSKCALKLRLSKLTIERYMNGHVYDVDTAVKVVAYMKKRIEKRNQSLKK